MISIVIPHYNRSDIINETLVSINNQTSSNYECIIVDDGSDNIHYCEVERLIKSYDNIKFIKRTGKLKGANSCRNQGAQLAKGDYLMFLDSDDLLDPLCIENRLKATITHQEMDMIIFKMGRFKSDIKEYNNVVNRFLKETSTSNLLKNFLSFNLPWQLTAALWKKEFFKEIQFDEELSRFQDVEVNIHALSKTNKIKYYPHQEIDSYYRESTYHVSASLKQLRVVFDNGIYLITKWSKILPAEDKIYLTGLLLFITNRYCDIISYKDTRDLKKIYYELGNQNLKNWNAWLAITLSLRSLNRIPWIDYFRNRFYFFGKKPFIVDYQS